MDPPPHDELNTELDALDALRKSVHHNLRLRPLPGAASSGSSSASNSRPSSMMSSQSLELPPLRPGMEGMPLSPNTPLSSYYTPAHEFFPPSTPLTPASPHSPVPVDPSTLYGRLLARRRPLLLDIRQPMEHVAFHILHSINIAIPTVIFRRMQAKGALEAGIPTIAGLRQYITTDASRSTWDKLMRPSSDTWDGDVILYGPDDLVQTLVPILVPLLDGEGSVDWLEGGIEAAKEPSASLSTLVVAGNHSEIASAGPVEESFGQQPRGLSQLDLSQGPRTGLPQIDLTSASTSSSSGSARQKPTALPLSPSEVQTPLMPGAMPRTGAGWMTAGGSDVRARQFLPEGQTPPPVPSMPSTSSSAATIGGPNFNLIDATPSPPPSRGAPATGSQQPPPRKASLQSLKKLDTRSQGSLRSKKSREKLKLDLSLEDDYSQPQPPLPTTLGIPGRPDGPGPGPIKSADPLRGKKSLDGLPKLKIGGAGGLALPADQKGSKSRSPSPSRLNLKHSNFNAGIKKAGELQIDAGPSSDETTIFHPTTPKASAHPSQSTFLPRHSRDDLPPSPSTARPETSRFPPPGWGGSSPVPPLPSGAGGMGGGAGAGWPGSGDESVGFKSHFGRHHATSSISSNASGSSNAEESPLPSFIISMILPGFLYLGPEPTDEIHLGEMKLIGVKRILNIAIECGPDDHGLNLSSQFKYHKIPMRDTVEEERVREGVREVCEVLDDARLHSAPTYVHCKAGKSRSVTAVIAYLIHANHWTLSRAYSFVLERRKGISPNIGFVSELMTFEEEELGGKSVGVQKSAGAQPADPAPQASVGNPHRRGAHVRESLPPAFVHSNSQNDASSDPVVDGAVNNLKLMGLGEEMEMRDKAGRYRHARRAPVDEQTLQPMRRVSKAGLEGFMVWNGPGE